MIIDWYGNSSFLIKSSIGKKILIDPFNIINKTIYDIPSDIVIFSKDLRINSDYLIKNPNTKLLLPNENYKDDNLTIESFTSFSDKLKGLKRGPNYIHKLEIDNITLLHLGYIGDLLTNDILNNIGSVDILFAPIGGNLCIDGLDSIKICTSINPKYIIPMCFRTELSQVNDFYFHGPKSFLSKSKNIHLNKSTKIDTTTLPKATNYPLTIFITC